MTIVRKSNVEFDQWPAFEEAVNKMIDDGIYQQLAGIHGAVHTDDDGGQLPSHRMHSSFGSIGTRRFLPWHRAYLIAFERELRKIDESLSLPYWDWDNDRGRLVGVTNITGIATRPRRPGLRPGQLSNGRRNAWFSSDALTEMFETSSVDYFFFTTALEGRFAGVSGHHNAGHTWVGGDMGNTDTSANDVLFFMHHAAIDRVWAKWQESNPDKMASLSGDDAKLDPWGDEFTVQNINDISDLGDDSYSYVDPVRPAPTDA